MSPDRLPRPQIRWILVFVGALSGSAFADSEVYCEVSSVNFAWVPEYGGTVIDATGTLALFNYDFHKSPGDTDRLHGANWLTPTRQELAERFRPGRRVVGKLCAERRLWLRDQLAAIRTAGQSRAVDMQSRDGPTAHTHCFVFGTGQDRATFVLLQDFGTTETHSLSPSAPQLANWLNAAAAEARRRAELPAKQHSCVDAPPPLTAPSYPDTPARRRAMEELKTVQRLHCEFADGNSTEVNGEQNGNHSAPARLSVVFTDLNSAAHRGRAEMFGAAYSVRVDISTVGLVLTNMDAERRNLSDVVTIVPYRVDDREIYPAVKQEILAHNYGAIATRYTGQCAPLP
jgi:hypothetical protein